MKIKIYSTFLKYFRAVWLTSRLSPHANANVSTSVNWRQAGSSRRFWQSVVLPKNLRYFGFSVHVFRLLLSSLCMKQYYVWKYSNSTIFPRVILVCVSIFYNVHLLCTKRYRINQIYFVRIEASFKKGKKWSSLNQTYLITK